MPKMLHEALNAKLKEEFPEMENPQAENMQLIVQFELGDQTHQREVMTNDEYDSFDFGEINTLSNSEAKAEEEGEAGSSGNPEAETDGSEDEAVESGEDTVKMYTEEEVKAMLDEQKAEMEKMMEDKGYMNKKSDSQPEEAPDEQEAPESPAETDKVQEDNEPKEEGESESEGAPEGEDKPDADGSETPVNQKSVQPTIMGEYRSRQGFVN